MTVQEYMDNPCRASSLPYWKTLSYDVPENMLIIHNDDFCKNKYNNYTDECYFRLINYLDKNYNFEIPYGYSLIESPIEVFSDHINSCYDDIMVTYQIVKGFTERQVYDEELWVAVVCNQTKEIVATGIAE